MLLLSKRKCSKVASQYNIDWRSCQTSVPFTTAQDIRIIQRSATMVQTKSCQGQRSILMPFWGFAGLGSWMRALALLDVDEGLWCRKEDLMANFAQAWLDFTRNAVQLCRTFIRVFLARINCWSAMGFRRCCRFDLDRDAARCSSKCAQLHKGAHWGFRRSLWALCQVILKTYSLIL